MRKDLIDEELSREKQEKDYLDDVSLEIELIDEDDKVSYKVGDLFLSLKQSEVTELLEKDIEAIDAKIEELESKESEISSRIKDLKSLLYAKFGDNINLER
ncbi:hypothetical protein TPHA_0F02100 [Tetrapisispora phaffii CBS 4417]|uniref:Prefoldin subunit 4 n=1 Tax=Tetrapisispora phaffii (strain ATCC 24235 / CBS 4417 / NBRC 1672 / NRRL Y-8282 / UCD 70-5) TaxID=1071381 RepID=G8BVB0_TETPH|nr:hypothetical protein TPHA_0F02100 [Tetrapisispora phaffii CBS 4417]CCE63692.1 hypothetical protein TPHA_0F02100 [Tetrapisispora phaffii CBS 4417]